MVACVLLHRIDRVFALQGYRPVPNDSAGARRCLSQGRYGGYMRISARNQLPGTIVEVLHGSVMSTVTIRLAGGNEVVSAITKDSAESLGLAVGDQVHAIIKATEVIVGKE